jgi:dTDP-6-deoxy-L-talose 4-dehydrogenase (NAD+)
MKVLVTGATGFVGQHVVPQLLAHGHTVTAVARNSSKACAFDWYEQVHFIACDIHQPKENAFQIFGSPDVLMHLAWEGLPNYKELFHFERNLFADYHFIKALVDEGLQHLLVTGTCLEYGMKNGCLSEDIATQPSNPYALAKDTLRKFLEAMAQQWDITVQWARLFYMYGIDQNPNSLLAQLDRAIDNGDPVFNMSGGEQLRDYLPVKEVAAKLVNLMEYPQCTGIVNICSGEPISVRRLVEEHLMRRNAEIKLNLGYYPYPDYEPMAFWGSCDKFDILFTNQDSYPYDK